MAKQAIYVVVMRTEFTDLNLEEFRKGDGLTYAGLAVLLKLSDASHARRIALGLAWPASPATIECIRQVSGGRVSIDAMHRLRLAEWRRVNGPPPGTPNLPNPTEARHG